MTKFFLLAVIFLNTIVIQAQNVGIGTTTPQSQLHIGDNSINELIIGRNKSTGGFTALYMGTSAVSNGYSYLQSVRSAGSQFGNLILNPANGNVGIATINPQFKLDVKGGSINTDSAYYMSGLPILASPGNGNLFTGFGAGDDNTTGANNTATGSFALNTNTTGRKNTAMGLAALFNNLNGDNNIALGYGALYSNTSADGNTAVGTEALYATINNQGTGRNTAIGLACMKQNLIGHSNTATGAYSLQNNLGGSGNAVIGFNAGLNTNASGNVYVGYASGESNISGDNNTCIGSSTDVGTANLENATALGAYAVVNISNKIRFGNSAVTIIEGSAAYSFPSDGRFKTNISETVAGLNFILKLRPVVYNFQAKKMDEFISGKDSSDKRFASLDYTSAENMRQSGFIAQEVEQAAKASGYDFNGIIIPKNERETYSLTYSQFVVPLVKAVQEQQQIILQLQKEIEELKRKTNSLK